MRYASAAVVAVIVLVAWGATAPAHALAAPDVPVAQSAQRAPGTTGALTTPTTPTTKKDRAAQTKSTKHGPPPAPGQKPARLINLYNFWTKEWLAIAAASPPPRDTLDRFLRDHFTNKPAAMEPKLLDIIVAAAANFHCDVVDIVSGFRHPKYNLILRKKGHQVARDSQHTHGNAIDFYLPNVATALLHTWAKAQKFGGVGLYAESGFVHMDTGPVRYWSGE